MAYMVIAGMSSSFIIILIALIIWETTWKGIALWKAGRNNHLVWFIFIFIFNTLGILPIIYLLHLKKSS